MSRRLYDSSRTRVRPVFDTLRARDPSGASWLQTLLSLPEGGPADAKDPSAVSPAIEEGCWDPREKALDAPTSLLSWLVRNVRQPTATDAGTSDDTEERRRRLASGHAETVQEALALLRSSTSRGWHVLEGPSRPDVYLRTPDALIVIEGKRTEPGPTTHTTWMPGRHQMLRHIDAAYEARDGRQVFGFFIVEADERGQVPEIWRAASETTVGPEALAGSLPHRSEEEVDEIRRSFLGVTTWQRACKALAIDADVLIDRLA